MNYDKRTVIYFAIFIVVALVFVAGAYLVYKGAFDGESILEKEAEVKTREEIIDDLTAPAGAGNEVSDEIIQNLTPPQNDNAPEGQEEQLPEVPQEIIDSLSAPK